MNDSAVVSPAAGGGEPASIFGAAAYGGKVWSPRTATHAEEIGGLWSGGIDSEWRRLKSVPLRRPDPEIIVDDADELRKAAGAVGCLTGVVERERA